MIRTSDCVVVTEITGMDLQNDGRPGSTTSINNNRGDLLADNPDDIELILLPSAHNSVV